MATLQEVLDFAQADHQDAKSVGLAAIAEADNALSSAEAAVSGLYVNYSASWRDPDDATVTIPVPPTIPGADISSDIKDAFDYAFTSFNENLKPQVLAYLDDFFPDISESIKTGSEQWLIDTINTGRYVPASVENAIWNRARDREVQDAQRAEQSLIDATAARGFDLPPGALAANIAANQTELSKKLATLEREIAIKDFDIANENTKFAIQQAVSMRVSFVGALADFIRSAMVQPGSAADYAKTILAAKTSFYDSALKLYSAQISGEELKSTVHLKNKELEERADRLWLDGAKSATDDKIKAAQVRAQVATAAATVLANVASSTFATRNTMLSVGGSAQ